MAGKYLLFFVLCFVVACYANDAPPSTDVPDSTAEPEDGTTAPVAPGTVGTPGSSSTRPVTQTVPPATQTVPPVTPTVPPVTPTVPPVTPTTAQSPCFVSPCSRGSTCAARGNQTFVCFCLPGENYNYISRTCENARVFPVQVSLWSSFYHPGLNDTASLEFKALAHLIVEELFRGFPRDGFSNATVISFWNISQTRVGSESERGLMASVELFFDTASNITTDELETKLHYVFGPNNFNFTDLCSSNPCDEKTTECSAENGFFNCSCKTDYIMATLSQRICLACPSGYYAKDSKECSKCSFGFSGLNCSESWELILVIVGSVLGALLLIAVILLPIMARRSSKKSSKKSKNADIGKPVVSPLPAKPPQAEGDSSFTNSPPPTLPASGFEATGMPRIPRATASSSWDSRSNLEMIPSNSRQNLVPMDRNSRLYDDDYDTNAYTRPQSSLYAPSRPRSNPYAQSRPQNNPYAQNQGQANPYYMQNSGRW